MWRRYTQHKLSLLQQTPNGAASEEAERAPPLLKNGTWGELPTRVGLKRKGSPGDRTSTADNSTVIVPSQSDQAAKAQQRAARDYEAEGLSELALALVWRKVALEVNCLMKTGEIRDSQDRNLFQSVQMLSCKQKLAATEHSVVEISESQKRITKKFNDFEMLEQKLGVCMNELDTVNKHFAQANVKLKDEIAHRVKLHNECEKLKQQQVQIGSEAAKKSKAKLASALERAAQAEAQLLASQAAAEKELKQAKANVVKAKAAADAAIAEAASSKVEQKAGQLPVGPNGSSLVAHNDASTKELQARGEQLEQLSTTELEALMQSMENQQMQTLQAMKKVRARMNVVELEAAHKIREEHACIICWDRNRQILLQPCNHLCYCQECMDSLEPEKLNRCPICRSKVKKTCQIYL